LQTSVQLLKVPSRRAAAAAPPAADRRRRLRAGQKKLAPMARYLLALLALSTARAGAPSAVSWLTPTAEPGRTQGGRATYQGGMPLGNGRTTATAWANTTSGGISLYLGSQDAMSSHGELFKLGLLEVALSPNPFTSGPYFNQTADLSSATVLLYAGGTSMADYAVLLTAYVDANSDSVLITAASRDPAAAFSLTARLSSTRPAAPWSYRPAFGFCGDVASQPDVFVDPLPPPRRLARAAPLAGRAALRHAGGHRRPLRALPRLPAGAAGFQPGSLIVYHRNVATDGLSLNMTLSQQGLAGLVATTPDHWSDLQSGLVLDGGAGPALTRAGPAALASAAPAAAFQLRATVLAVQTDVESEWLADVAALVATSAAGTPAARAAHEAYWGGFWGRSFIAVNASAPGADAAALNSAYAVTRYTQAIQSRGTLWPIKFNGMAFIQAVSPGDGAADARDWGPSNWWQNTRLPCKSSTRARPRWKARPKKTAPPTIAHPNAQPSHAAQTQSQTGPCSSRATLPSSGCCWTT